MPLTRDELNEQLQNICVLLDHANYTMCLTPEAIDLSYEIRGPEVRIRADRRNKGRPRVGRISSVLLNEPGMAETFEREFWAMFRLTEPDYKDRTMIRKWFEAQVHNYKGPNMDPSTRAEEFDVFLCHNNVDKPEVKAVAEMLRQRGIRTWLDEENLIPGRVWQRALEAQIKNIRSAAVFVGRSGLGPWTSMELDAFLREFASRDCPVIPVILASATTTPELPVFLKAMHWVDFRRSEPAPLDQLIWGVTGRQPAKRRRKTKGAKKDEES
jgi:hypothetical protein